MKVYRWVETDEHWIAVIRPDEVFISKEIDLSVPAEIGECDLIAKHLDGHEATYALAFGKRKFLEVFVRRMVEKMPDIYLESDEGALRKLAKKAS